MGQYIMVFIMAEYSIYYYIIRHIMEIYSIVVVAAADPVFFVVFPSSHCVACGGVPVVTCWCPKKSKKIPDILVVGKISRSLVFVTKVDSLTVDIFNQTYDV